ncbi:MAG: hypothetical protein LQ340_001653 [Diploschistes diacapsis]|nr:MAG: hypothetical protein LQ340_001653 [Diploschistes diacapsis]
MLEDEKEFQATRRPPYKRRRWQLGMLMFIVSNLVGSTIQITTLPLPVLSTLQASGLVFNSICATLILGEPFTRYSLAGTILVAGGAGLIASFGAISEPAHSLDQLLELLGRWQFVLWMVGTAIAVVAILIGSRTLKLLGGQNSNSPRMRRFRGMSYGAISGILSAHSLLVAKSAVELLVRTIVAGDNQFNRVPSWIILLGLGALALSQLYFLHRGLKLCSTSPQFHPSSSHALQIALGTLILLTGVVCLSWRLNSDSITKPALSQTPLTPGMGFVPTDSDSETSTSPLLSSQYEDEHEHELSTSLLPPPSRSITMPAKLTSASLTQQPTAYGTASAHPATTSTTNLPTLKEKPRRNIRLPQPSISPPPRTSPHMSPSSLGLLGQRNRRKTISFSHEADEIWSELEEDAPTPVLSPISSRRRSSWGAGRALTPRRLRPPSAAIEEGVESGEGGEEVADERTGLLARSGTGRSYRGRWRRSRHASVGGEGSGGERRASQSRSQDAIGGWWKMRRWLRGGGKEKGKLLQESRTGADNGDEEGGGPEAGGAGAGGRAQV